MRIVKGAMAKGAMVLSAMAKGAAPPLSEKRPGCTTVSNSPQNHTRGRGRCFFAVSTGGGLESIFVEEGSTVWAHYEKEDYRMIAGEDDKWVNKCYKITKVQKIFKPNQKPFMLRTLSWRSVQTLRHGHPLSHPQQSTLALTVPRAPRTDGYPH